MPSSRWWLAPDLIAAIASGKNFTEWLAGREPAASYARISADLTRDEHGVEDQHGNNERAAARSGLAIVKYYEDNDKSAARDDVVREAFNMLVSELGRRVTRDRFPIFGVLCTERERLYRRPGDYEQIVKALMVDERGFLYEDGKPFDLYGDGSEVLGLFGVAQSMREIRKIRDRTRRSHVSRSQRGQFTGGPRRFGWLGADKSVGRPVNVYKNDEEWPVLRQMVSDALAGKSWRTIARELNSQGIKTARGGLWSAVGVSSLLTNPYLCGYRMLRDELVIDADGRPVVGQWDAVATPDEWRALTERKRLAAAQRGIYVEGADLTPGSPSDRSRKRLFSGFLRCGAIMADGSVCNTALSGTTRSRGGAWYYRCYTYVLGTTMGVPHVSRDGVKTDEYLIELVKQKLEKEMENEEPAEAADWPDADLLAAVEERAATLRQQWRELKISDQFFYSEYPQLEGKLKELQRSHQKYDLEIRRGGPISENIRAEWDRMDLDQQRAAVGRALLAVIVLPLERAHAGRAPFDPSRLKPVWKDRFAESSQSEDPA